MSALIHGLHDDFPEFADRLIELKEADAEFADKVAEYDLLNRKVVEAETLEKPTGHFHEEELKKKRARLKDEIYTILSA